MKKWLFFWGYLILGCLTINAQQRCSTVSHNEFLKETKPGYAQNLHDTEQFMRSGVVHHKALEDEILIVPVVVHIVYKTEAQNVSDDEVYRMITTLNEDFNGQNGNVPSIPSPFNQVVANMQIQFVLATTDPSGTPTNGIVRKKTNRLEFTDTNYMKFDYLDGDDAWDVTQYFNIWVCQLENIFLGYAEQPTSSPSNSYGAVVNTCTVKGYCEPFELNKTIVHEIGHCFTLRHIWGDDGNDCTGSDEIDDTPNQTNRTFGCPSFPELDECSPSNPGVMFMNFMDYTDDVCMAMFTEGQKVRARNALLTYKESLTLSDVAEPILTTDVGLVACIEPSTVLCDNWLNPQVRIRNFGANDLTSVTIDYTIIGLETVSYTWTGNLGFHEMATVNLPSTTLDGGVYSLSLNIADANGYPDDDDSNNTKTVNTISVPSEGLSLPFYESFEASDDFPTGWLVNNPDNFYTWQVTNEAAINGYQSAKMHHYNYYLIPQHDELLMPPLDLSNANIATLRFQHAYAQYSNNGSDTLQVLVSTDCGNSWTILYEKSFDELSTVSGTVSSDFVPTVGQWQANDIDLNAYIGTAGLLLKFVSINNFQNNLFIDDISVGEFGVGINTTLAINESWQVYPNPATNVVNITSNYANNNADKPVFISLFNAKGEQLQTLQTSSNKLTTALQLHPYPSGLYLLRIYDRHATYSKKLYISR